MTIKITKQLATMEDLAIGTGTVVQERNGVPLTLTKIDFVPKSEVVIRVTSIAAMEAYSAPVGYIFSLNAGGRSGVFDVIAGDFSTELAADTLNGVYVGLADNPLATVKVAKRRTVSAKSVMVEWFGVNEESSDNSVALQAAADFAPVLEGLPGNIYKHSSSINLTLFGAALISKNAGVVYSGVRYEYDGSGAQFICAGSANYLTVYRVQLKGSPATATDYYNTGSTAFDLTDTSVSIVCKESSIDGFQYLFTSNYHSFYNSFTDNRFTNFEVGLYNFSNNNLTFTGNRCQRFHDAVRVNGAGGPTNIGGNSFELFNGFLVDSTGAEQGIINFYNNYVEIVPTNDLPTNFPSRPNAIPGKFGGNVLFAGPFGCLNIYNNEMQIAGVTRVVTASSMKHFYADGNNYHDYSTGSNLNQLYALPSVDSLHINDSKGLSVGAGPFSAEYNQGAIRINTAEGMYFHYDAITESIIKTNSKFRTLSLLNAWTAPNEFFGNPIAVYDNGSVFLSGLIDGSNSTDATAFSIPLELRPYEYGTTKIYANITTFSDQGFGTIVRFRYFYETGVVKSENSPASLSNVNLDGVFIPPRF